MLYTNSMPSFKERSPYERETLMFPNKEQAAEFAEQVAERMRKEQESGVRRDREIVREEVAEQMAQAGQAVSLIKTPWEHTPDEHAEAQALVDIAFAEDLNAAIKQAQSSRHYPRILDLFHDVLTNEMYDLVQEYRLNRQPLIGWVLGMLLVGACLILGVLLVLIWRVWMG